jgi:predicted dehydrogenase
MSQPDLSRRAFLGSAAAPLAAGAATDRISLGLIGAGGRGNYHLADLARLKDLNFAVAGICDVWTPNRERAADTVRKTFGNTPRQTSDYRRMLEWRDIDAVIIASPDYSHSVMLKHAVEAGKDAYCEKPMGTVFSEAKAAYLTVKNSRQVVQIGTQKRSDGGHIAAAKLIQSGVLGEITRINVSVNFQEPRWRRDYSKVAHQDVDWNSFVMHRPAKPYEPRLLREWQLFSYNTNGIAGLWMSHYSDVVHWFMQDPYPASAVANGGVFLWKDGRETSDVFEAVLTYPKGFLFTFAMSLTIQPLLFEMISTLTPQETADGNTLFNVVQRLGGSIGISALATVFQTRTTDYVRQALSMFHIDAGAVHIGQSSTALSTLPATMRDTVGTAAINGFHETVWILVGLSLIGLVLAFFLKPAKKIVEVPAIKQPVE